MIQNFSIQCLVCLCFILAIGSAWAVDINLSDTQPFANQASSSAIVQPINDAGGGGGQDLMGFMCEIGPEIRAITTAPSQKTSQQDIVM